MTNIPREVTLQGDLRFLPFVSAAQIRAAVEGYVSDLNSSVIRRGGLPHTGGVDRFIIPNPKKSGDSDEAMIQGVLEWKWDAMTFTGVACDMDSVGYRALCDSIFEVTKKCSPFALTGSLPIIADLQAQGYDVQVTGFGRFDAYHARQFTPTTSGCDERSAIRLCMTSVRAAAAALSSHLISSDSATSFLPVSRGRVCQAIRVPGRHQDPREAYQPPQHAHRRVIVGANGRDATPPQRPEAHRAPRTPLVTQRQTSDRTTFVRAHASRDHARMYAINSPPVPCCIHGVQFLLLPQCEGSDLTGATRRPELPSVAGCS